MITPEKFLKLIKEDDENIFKLGTIAEVVGDGKAKVKFDGEDIPSGKSYLSAGLMPGVGGRVLLAQVKGTYLILGGIGSGGVIDNLESTSTSSALSANMGRELFQYANDGKTAIADAIVGLGGSASSNSTFQQLANAIGTVGIRTASGSDTSASNGQLNIRTIGFAPNYFVATSGSNYIYVSWSRRPSNIGVVATKASSDTVQFQTASVSSSSFAMTVPAGRTFNWYASE